MIQINHIFNQIPSLNTLLEEHFTITIQKFIDEQLTHYEGMKAAPTIADFSFADSVRHLFPYGYPDKQIETVFGQLQAAAGSTEPVPLNIITKYVLYQLICEEIDIAACITGKAIIPLPKRLKDAIKEHYNRIDSKYALFTYDFCIECLENMQNYVYYLFHSTEFMRLSELGEPENGAPDNIEWDYENILYTCYENKHKEQEALERFLDNCKGQTKEHKYL